MFTSKFTVLKVKNYIFIFKRLVSNQVRVRFAPSPTGNLHLGGLRTALYNHLFAKSQNGVTLLRIEDTDLSRKIPYGAENLIEDLAWCGITYDEGPYYQSERKEIYQKYAKQLVDQGDAYYCFCSETRLMLIRKQAVSANGIPKYDNHCRHLSENECKRLLEKKPYCIRFKLSNSADTFNDLVCGLTFHDVAAVEGDPVILKSDGFPTYHLANVVDDHLMNITHVLRGSEWLTSTAKHLLLYRALKWNPPYFGHLPLLMNLDGTKLSKRQGNVQIRQLKKDGYFPNTLINYIIRLGGGFNINTTEDLKTYTFDELVGMFDLHKIKGNSCKVPLKLLSLYNNAVILRMFETDSGRRALVKKAQEVIQNHFQHSKYKNTLAISDERIEFVLKIVKNRISRLEDLVEEDYYYIWIWDSDWKVENEIYNKFIKYLIEQLETVTWSLEELQQFLKSFCKQHSDIKYSDFMHALRIVLTGKKSGPKIAEIMSMLSKEDVVFRLSKAVESISSCTANQN